MNNVLSFLKNLEANNNKDWFDKNKESYLSIKSNFETTVNEILFNIKKFDSSIAKDLEAKQCVYRIYKDVRFSKDKTPYKINMGASINCGGKKSGKAGYYLHIQNNASFIAGGVYMPNPEVLNNIRQEIDYNSKDFIKIISSKSFTAYFKGLDNIDKLKLPPKGYDINNPMNEYIKHKHFIASCKLTNSDVNNLQFVNTVNKGFKAVKPLIDFLNNAI
ncbi:MAG: DUF2461 domain-containing protein [Bacteroidetes bacterium]|nr:DUF2461 domain-containing protein [Bacteroidota bacterium]